MNLIIGILIGAVAVLGLFWYLDDRKRKRRYAGRKWNEKFKWLKK